MLQSPVFSPQNFVEEFNQWVRIAHPEEEITVTGYYIPYGGGVSLLYERD